MSVPLKGKSFAIKVSTTTGGTYNAVANMNSASMNRSGENLDITTFTQSYINRLQGLKDCSYSVSGFHDAGDTNGQTVIETAFENDSDLFVQFLPNGTAGWKQQVRVASIDIDVDVAGVVSKSYSLEGTGAISTV